MITLDGESYMSRSDLQNRLVESTPARIMLDMIFAADAHEQVKCVERAIDYIAQDMVKHRQAYQARKEDELTIYIIANLRSMGFRAAHDTQYGGHCDIVVEATDEFLWLAEAKIYYSYVQLLEGVEQINVKYGTGLVRQSNADLIIYYYETRADEMLTKWGTRLRNEYPTDVVNDFERDGLFFRSTHLHETTGNQFHIRHKAIPLKM